MAIALRYAARTDLGLGPKSRNEDSGYAGPHLLVLADGMGGHAAGDVASSMIVGQLAPLDGESIGADNALRTLERSIHEANARLRAAVKDNADLTGMGSTTIAMLRAGNKLAMAHIGDSRAYLLRDGALTQITKDHSFVQQLVDEHRITPEEAEDHPQRSLVTRVMTGQADDEPDLSMRELKVGDRYLLCSDGLSDFVRRDVIEEILTDEPTPDRAAERLVAVALKASARDNVTVVVADVVDLEYDRAPSTVPEVVGAASLRDREGKRTRGLPVSPAEKAAHLSRSASGGAPDPQDDVPLLAEEGRSRRVVWGRRLLVAVVALAVVTGATYAGWAWTQRQLFIGPEGGYVALFQGVTQDLGPVRLSHTESVSDIALADLPTHEQDVVNGRITVDDKADADARLAFLRQAAADCRRQAALGVACGSVPVTTPTPSTATTGTPAATPAGPTTTGVSTARPATPGSTSGVAAALAPRTTAVPVP